MSFYSCNTKDVTGLKLIYGLVDTTALFQMDKANEEAMTTDQETIMILQYIVRMRQMVSIPLQHVDHCLFQLKQNEDGIRNDMVFSIQEEVCRGKPFKGTMFVG